MKGAMKDTIRAAVIENTAAVLRELGQAAPDDVRGDLAAMGAALKAGDASPMVTMERAGALLRERWPAGFDVSARAWPLWSMVERRPRA